MDSTMRIPKIFISVATISLYSCNPNTDTIDAVSDDSTINALNAADTISTLPQTYTDSVKRAYLDSFTKHIDTNNAEFGNHK